MSKLPWLKYRRGHVTQTQYDALYRPTTTIDAKQQTIVTTYDKVGNVRTITDKRGNVKDSRYDALNRVTEQYIVSDSLNFRLVLNEYDLELGSGVRKNAVTDAENNTAITTFDFRGNPLVTTLPGDSSAGFASADVVQAYDVTGLLTRSTDAAGLTTQYTHHADGTVASVTNPEIETTAYQYDLYGNAAVVIQPSSTTQTSTYDARNRLVMVEDHLGNTTRFEYDPNNNLRHQYMPAASDSGESHVEYEYDTLNRKRQHIQHKTSGNLITRYSYDAEGNLTQMIDAKGQAFAYAYDELNRQTGQTFPAGDDIISIATTYDANNNVNVITEHKPGNVLEITDHDYDALDRLTARNQRGHSISYGYDKNGNRTSVTAVGGSTTYTFDTRNRLHTALANGHTTTYTYLQNGWLDTVAQGNGTGVDYDYDNTGRVTKILNSQAGGALLSQFDYTYDDNGNRTQQIETQNGFTADRVVITDYVYDDLNRLENFTHTTTDNGTATGVEQHSYTFYPSYDRKTETVVKDGATQTQRTYTYDETYWVETIEEAAPGKVGTITYAYDANGNTQTKTNTTGDGPASSVFTYNNRNQLKTVAAGNTGSEVGQGQYHYNYAGMRIRHLGSSRGNVEYVYDDKSIIDEVVSGTTTPIAHYRYGDRLLSLETSGAEQFYHYASLRTTANLTDASGQNQVAYRVDPYGEITKQEGESVNRQVFTGHEHDTETGLIYMKARFYDPDIGRFLTQDTYLGEHGTPPSLHRYLYAYGNPTVWWDPTGHSSIMIGDPGMQMYLHEMMPDGRAKDLAQAQFELEQRAMAPMTAGIAVQTTKDAISGVVGGFAYLGDYLLSPYSEKHSDSFKKKTSGFTSGVKAIYDSNGGVIADGLVQSINAGAAELEAGNYYAAGEKSASAAQMQMGVAAAPWAIRSSAAMAANGVKTGINKASSIDWKFLTSEKKPDGGGQGNDIGNSAGEPKSEYVFRADRRTPEQIKKEGGFRAKNPEANVPLEDYVNTGKKSQYVSTTRDPFAAEAHVKNELETEAYIYKIKNNGKGRDVNKELPANTYADESEVVFDFIDACDIVCSQKVRADGLPIEPPVPFN